ncbi:MAG: primase [Verrucomicrobiota bacterium]
MPRYSEETIQRVAAANDIVEVIGSYFPLRRAGTTYKALCPFHQERSPSFTVNPARQIFKCFGCGVGGTVIRFVMEYEHVDFGTAMRRLAEKAGLRLEEESFSAADREKLDLRRRLLALHLDAAEFFHQQLLKSAGAREGRAYLQGRGISSSVAKDWKLGFALDSWDGLLRWALERGYTREELLAGGLASQREGSGPNGECYDRFRGRIMFPICNDTGEVLAFSGRILQSDAKAAKYVNSPETPLFTKGAVLFGLHRSKRALIEKSSAIVCEGQLDLITAFEAGIQNVIAPQGTAFTPKQARILKRYVEEVILCFDADAAGEKATERSLPALLAERLSVRVAQMQVGEDPDSMIRTRGAEAFRAQIQGAKEFFSYKLEQFAQNPAFHSPRGKTHAAHKLAEWVALLGDPILREIQIQQIASFLGIGTEELASVVRQSSERSRSSPDLGDAETPPDSPQEDQAASLSVPTDPTIHLLLSVLLHSAEARDWLLEEDWRARLASENGGELAISVLEHAALLNSPGGITAFLASSPPAVESLLSAVLEQKPPENPLQVIQDCWVELERRQLRALIGSLKSRQKSANLSLEAVAQIHQQILDLQKRLLDISRPFSPPL